MAVSSLPEDNNSLLIRKKRKKKNISDKIEKYATTKFILNNKMIPCKHRHF